MGERLICRLCGQPGTYGPGGLHERCVRAASFAGVVTPRPDGDARAAELSAIEAAVEAGKVQRLWPQHTPKSQRGRGRIQRSGQQYR